MSSRSATSALVLIERGLLGDHGAGIPERAEILWQQVMRIGEAIHHGLIRAHRQRRGQQRRDALVAGDGIEVVAVPDGTFDAGRGFGEPHPGTRLSIERAAQQAIALQFLLALRREFREHPFVVAQRQGKMAAVGFKGRGRGADIDLNGFRELDLLG